MNLVVTAGAGHDTFAFDDEHLAKRNAQQEQNHFPVEGRCAPQKENIRPETEHPPTMDGISSFLETMHSKNLTLKRLAKVQQRRIDELTQENIALRQASEMKDEEIRRTKEHLNLLRDATGDADLSEIVPTATGNRLSKTGLSSNSDPTDDSKVPSGSTRPSKKTSGQRRKTSIIVSHKVAVKRVMHLMRKINGAYNRRSVGLYTFACCFAQAALLACSAEVSSTLRIPHA